MEKINLNSSFAEFGRNAPCPCGSGKKYKNCCDGGTNPFNSKELKEFNLIHFIAEYKSGHVGFAMPRKQIPEMYNDMPAIMNRFMKKFPIYKTFEDVVGAFSNGIAATFETDKKLNVKKMGSLVSELIFGQMYVGEIPLDIFETMNVVYIRIIPVKIDVGISYLAQAMINFFNFPNINPDSETHRKQLRELSDVAHQQIINQQTEGKHK